MKKIKIIAFLGIISFVSVVFNVPSTVSAPIQDEGSSADPLLIGFTDFDYDLDPQNNRDDHYSKVIHQVNEGLFAYDLGDQYFRTVPRLAADCGIWSDDHLEFTITLRKDVTFHNGHEFNASTVKASFDRLIHLIEIEVLKTAKIYKPLNGELVIKEIVVVDEFTVKFVLNYMFAPFITLLCFTSSMIVDASVMPANDIILPNATELIGTGPYKFLGNDGEKVEFEFYENYYRGVPAVKKFTFIKYENSTAISTDLLAGNVHMGSYDRDFLDDFLESDILTVEESTIDLFMRYVSMNNEEVNKTMRHAISYAIDYEYIISEIFSNYNERMTSVVPPIIAYHQSQDVATYNISKARQILIDAGLSQGLDQDSEDSEWVALAESAHRIASYSYRYVDFNDYYGKIGLAFKEDLSQIGIAVGIKGYSSPPTSFTGRRELATSTFCLTGYFNGRNDPSYFINPLFSINSTINHANVNDSWLQEKMMEGLSEFSETARAHLYVDIQHYIATDLMPWVFISYTKSRAVHSVNITDFQSYGIAYYYVFLLTWYGDEATWDDEMYCNKGCTPIDYIADYSLDREHICGYCILVMLSGAAATVITIIKKRKKK